MIRKFAVLALAAAVLCGCVLQSQQPLYTDDSAELVLGAQNGVARMSSWREGKWVEDNDERVEIVVEDKHYVARAKSDVVLHFVRLRDNWFVVQGVETGSSAAYMLAEVSDGAAEGRVISCTDLKANPASAKWVKFEGDDCFVRPDAQAKELFTALLENPRAPSFRMEIIQ